MDNAAELISEVFMDKGKNNLIVISMDENTIERIKILKEEYIDEFSVEVLDNSMIIRAAIIQRLIVEGGGSIN